MNVRPANPRPPSKEGGHGRSALLMHGMTALFWLAQYAHTPYINAELTRMGKNAAFMGLVAGGYGLAQLLVRVPLGMMADRLGRQKPFIILGSALTALSGLAYLWWYTPFSFLVLRFFTGVGSATWVNFTVLYSGYFDPSEGPRRISQLDISNRFGRLAGFVAVGALVGRYTVLASFWVGAVVGCAAFLLSLLIGEQPRARGTLTLSGLKQLARNRHMQVVSLLGLLVQLVAFSTYIGFTVNLAMRLNASDAQLSWLNIVLMIFTMLSNFVMNGTRLVKAAPERVITFGFGLAAVYCVAAPLCQSMGALYAVQALGGISSGLTFSMLLGQCVKGIPPDQRSAAMGLYQTVYGIGMTLGPVGMGVLIDWLGLDLSFFAVAALALVSAWVSHRFLTPHESRAA